jgi:hypothetical protein
VLSKDDDGDRRDVLARIVKKLKRVHDLTRTEVRATFYPQSIESLRVLAKDYDIELPEHLLADTIEYDTDLLEEFEKRQEKKNKDAERKRLGRKLKTQQRAAIKVALKIPVREIIEMAKQSGLQQRLAEWKQQRETSMNPGRYLTGDPDQQQLITNTDTEKVAAAVGRAASLGSPSFDSETGEPQWPEGDRRHVQPQGAGSEASEEQNAGIKRFEVKLDEPTEGPLGFPYSEWLSAAARKYFAHEKDFFVCRLCAFDCFWVQDSEQHLREVHGDDGPKHDQRFGNVIQRHIEEVLAKVEELKRPGATNGYVRINADGLTY